MNTPVFNELFFDRKYENQMNQAKDKGIALSYSQLLQ